MYHAQEGGIYRSQPFKYDVINDRLPYGPKTFPRYKEEYKNYFLTK